MTIKELYAWAEKNNALDMKVVADAYDNEDPTCILFENDDIAPRIIKDYDGTEIVEITA